MFAEQHDRVAVEGLGREVALGEQAALAPPRSARRGPARARASRASGSTTTEPDVPSTQTSPPGGDQRQRVGDADDAGDAERLRDDRRVAGRAAVLEHQRRDPAARQRGGLRGGQVLGHEHRRRASPAPAGPSAGAAPESARRRRRSTSSTSWRRSANIGSAIEARRARVAREHGRRGVVGGRPAADDLLDLAADRVEEDAVRPRRSSRRFGSIASARCDSSRPADAARNARASRSSSRGISSGAHGLRARSERDRLEVDGVADAAAAGDGDALEPLHASSPSEERNRASASTAASASKPRALTSTVAPEGAAR